MTGLFTQDVNSNTSANERENLLIILSAVESQDLLHFSGENVVHREAELAAKGKHFTDTSAVLVGRETKLASRELELKSREADLATREAELARRTRELPDVSR